MMDACDQRPDLAQAQLFGACAFVSALAQGVPASRVFVQGDEGEAWLRGFRFQARRALPSAGPCGTVSRGTENETLAPAGTVGRGRSRSAKRGDWPAAEKDLLRACHGHLGAGEIGALIDRSGQAVKNEWHRMGLRGEREHRPAARPMNRIRPLPIKRRTP